MSSRMASSPGDRIVRLFDEADRGQNGARDELFAALYGELRRLAGAHLHRHDGLITISATTLLHEAYLDIARRSDLAFPSRGHFMSYASRAMRGLVMQYVRHKLTVKRGGELTFAPLDEASAQPAGESIDVERLGQALEELATLDKDLAELVDLKFFCGLSLVEIAALRGVSERTVQRDWAKARALLHKSLTEEE
jgi:RNA polymerase sigma factor (TIGR02999 family)